MTLLSGWLSCLGVLLLALGCVPFVVPPARVRAGASVLNAGSTAPTPSAHADGSVGELSVAFHPLQLTRRETLPWVDFGLGYHAEGPLGESNEAWLVHGPELELGYYPLRETRWRGGMFTELSVLKDAAHSAEWGMGASLGLTAELRGFSDSTFHHSSDDAETFGAIHGQWGVGLYAAANFRSLEDRSYLMMTFGVTVRLPVIGGVVCCAWPSSDAESQSDGEASYRSERPDRESDHHSTRSRRNREYAPARPRGRHGSD